MKVTVQEIEGFFVVGFFFFLVDFLNGGQLVFQMKMTLNSFIYLHSLLKEQKPETKTKTTHVI